jgi:tetratricopeptide (TPR) repeat protein
VFASSQAWTAPGVSTALAVLAICSVVAGQAAADPIEDALSAARADVESGRCEQAQERLAPIAGLQNRARLLGGLCLIRTGRYAEALASLDRARGARDLTGAQVGDVELYRGVALYHLERYSEATAALVAAEGLTSEPAELALYRGLIALRNGDNESAAPDLEAAALLSPALTEPVASYYAGLAWNGASRRDEARAAFKRVIAIDGENGAWGRQARELLGATDPHPYSVRGTAGLEYDSNVILRGGATQFPSSDSPASTRKADGRGIWSVDGGIQLVERGRVGAGVTAGYSGTAQFHRDDFNTQYPRIGGYVVDRLSTQTSAQLRYEFGSAWVDNHEFLRTQLAEAGLTHTWERAGTTVAVVDFVWNDLRFRPRDVPDTCATPNDICGPTGINERNARDRDGVGVGGAFEHRYLVPLPQLVSGTLEELRIGGGYRFRYYRSQGSEWKYMSHVASALIELEFPFDVSLSTRASYEFRDFANPSTFPDRPIAGTPYSLAKQDRREHQIDIVADLEKKLTSNLSISTRWSYTNNESNRRVYDYSRHIVGAYVNLRFD